MYLRKTGTRQTESDKKLGKWVREDRTKSFIKALHVEKREKPTDTSRPLIVVDACLLRYFHY